MQKSTKIPPCIFCDCGDCHQIFGFVYIYINLTFVYAGVLPRNANTVIGYFTFSETYCVSYSVRH